MLLLAEGLYRFVSKLLPAGAVAAAFLLAPAARAHPWNSNPQPLLEATRTPGGYYVGTEPFFSDPASPLAWDPGRRTLWFFGNGWLQRAYWIRFGFWNDYMDFAIQPNPAAGLMIDTDVHFLYYVSGSGIPYCVQASGAFPATPLGTDPVERLLAVDPLRHSLFAYDANAHGVRRYTYETPARGGWTSSLIATGLGEPGDAGVFDNIRSVLYATYQTADPSLPRDSLAQSIDDPSGAGLLAPWPLVATSVSGSNGPASIVLDETGVPQRPAVRLVDQRVFYARRDDFDSVHFYQPAGKRTLESSGTINGCSGVDTYVDNESYPIEAPQYPASWYGDGDVEAELVSIYWPQLTGPITVVPYYLPIGSTSAMPDRLAHFSAIYSPASRQLVQNRVRNSGELVAQQTAWQLGGYFYRDSKGVLATQDSWGRYPPLGPDFDPVNPPASFAALASTNVFFYAAPSNVSTSASNSLPAVYTLDANAAIMPPHLTAPAQVTVRTFGYTLSGKPAQPGGRYQTYTGSEVDRAVPCTLAIDPRTGVVFYTQAADPNASSLSQEGWIVMVY